MEILRHRESVFRNPLILRDMVYNQDGLYRTALGRVSQTTKVQLLEFKLSWVLWMRKLVNLWCI